MRTHISVLLGLVFLIVTPLQADTLGDLGDVAPVEGQPSGWHGIVGVAAVSLPEYTGAKDNETIGLPLIIVNWNDRFFFNVAKGGYWVTKSDSMRFGIGFKPRRGYESTDDPILTGMQDRDTSLEIGLLLRFNVGQGHVGVELYTDATDNSDGESAIIEYSVPVWRKGRRHEIRINAGAEYLSEDVVDYYYGVRSTEAIPFMRPTYVADGGAVNPFVTATGRWSLGSSRWSLITALKFTKRASDIKNSPIVQDDSESLVLIGAGYTF